MQLIDRGNLNPVNHHGHKRLDRIECALAARHVGADRHDEITRRLAARIEVIMRRYQDHPPTPEQLKESSVIVQWMYGLIYADEMRELLACESGTSDHDRLMHDLRRRVSARLAGAASHSPQVS